MLKHSLVRKTRNRTINHGTSLVEAAKFLGVDQSTLYVALQRGQIPTTTRNGRTVISQAALMAYQVRTRPLL
ncbi:MAG: helix-turn-helix domain-containing protein [Nostoc sp. TH1S01]|nr:helix-turn-helix domain-containing protein [Nostoc sp. TH1S01]